MPSSTSIGDRSRFDPGQRPDVPWAAVRIREAAIGSIDREAMVDVLCDGRADRLTQFLMAARHEGCVTEPATAELLQSFMHETGFQIEIRELGWAGRNTIRLAREAHVFHPLRNAPVRPTDVGLDVFFNNAGPPANGYEDATSEALVADYRASFDPEERDDLAQQIFTHHFETDTTLPIATGVH